MSSRWFWCLAVVLLLLLVFVTNLVTGSGRIGRYQFGRAMDQIIVRLDTSTGEMRAYHVGRSGEGVTLSARDMAITEIAHTTRE
jgi:hypothetical protein